MSKKSEEAAQLVPLSKHVHFARALAGLPRVALGIAAGATLFTMSAGCQIGCNGSYGAIPPPTDAMVDREQADAEADAGPPDAGSALVTDAGQGGGPSLAPPLPAEWV